MAAKSSGGRLTSDVFITMNQGQIKNVYNEFLPRMDYRRWYDTSTVNQYISADPFWDDDDKLRIFGDNGCHLPETYVKYFSRKYGWREDFTVFKRRLWTIADNAAGLLKQQPTGEYDVRDLSNLLRAWYNPHEYARNYPFYIKGGEIPLTDDETVMGVFNTETRQLWDYLTNPSGGEEYLLGTFITSVGKLNAIYANRTFLSPTQVDFYDDNPAYQIVRKWLMVITDRFPIPMFTRCFPESVQALTLRNQDPNIDRLTRHSLCRHCNAFLQGDQSDVNEWHRQMVAIFDDAKANHAAIGTYVTAPESVDLYFPPPIVFLADKTEHDSQAEPFKAISYIPRAQGNQFHFGCSTDDIEYDAIRQMATSLMLTQFFPRLRTDEHVYGINPNWCPVNRKPPTGKLTTVEEFLELGRAVLVKRYPKLTPEGTLQEMGYFTTKGAAYEFEDIVLIRLLCCCLTLEYPLQAWMGLSGTKREMDVSIILNIADAYKRLYLATSDRYGFLQWMETHKTTLGQNQFVAVSDRIERLYFTVNSAPTGRMDDIVIRSGDLAFQTAWRNKLAQDDDDDDDDDDEKSIGGGVSNSDSGRDQDDDDDWDNVEPSEMGDVEDARSTASGLMKCNHFLPGTGGGGGGGEPPPPPPAKKTLVNTDVNVVARARQLASKLAGGGGGEPEHKRRASDGDCVPPQQPQLPAKTAKSDPTSDASPTLDASEGTVIPNPQRIYLVPGYAIGEHHAVSMTDHKSFKYKKEIDFLGVDASDADEWATALDVFERPELFRAPTSRDVADSNRFKQMATLTDATTTDWVAMDQFRVTETVGFDDLSRKELLWLVQLLMEGVYNPIAWYRAQLDVRFLVHGFGTQVAETARPMHRVKTFRRLAILHAALRYTTFTGSRKLCILHHLEDLIHAVGMLYVGRIQYTMDELRGYLDRMNATHVDAAVTMAKIRFALRTTQPIFVLSKLFDIATFSDEFDRTCPDRKATPTDVGDVVVQWISIDHMAKMCVFLANWEMSLTDGMAAPPKTTIDDLLTFPKWSPGDWRTVAPAHYDAPVDLTTDVSITTGYDSLTAFSFADNDASVRNAISYVLKHEPSGLVLAVPKNAANGRDDEYMVGIDVDLGKVRVRRDIMNLAKCYVIALCDPPAFHHLPIEFNTGADYGIPFGKFGSDFITAAFLSLQGILRGMRQLQRGTVSRLLYVIYKYLRATAPTKAERRRPVHTEEAKMIQWRLVDPRPYALFEPFHGNFRYEKTSGLFITFGETQLLVRECAGGGYDQYVKALERKFHPPITIRKDCLADHRTEEAKNANDSCLSVGANLRSIFPTDISETIHARAYSESMFATLLYMLLDRHTYEVHKNFYGQGYAKKATGHHHQYGVLQKTKTASFDFVKRLVTVLRLVLNDKVEPRIVNTIRDQLMVEISIFLEYHHGHHTVPTTQKTASTSADGTLCQFFLTLFTDEKYKDAFATSDLQGTPQLFDWALEGCRQRQETTHVDPFVIYIPELGYFPPGTPPPPPVTAPKQPPKPQPRLSVCSQPSLPPPPLNNNDDDDDDDDLLRKNQIVYNWLDKSEPRPPTQILPPQEPPIIYTYEDDGDGDGDDDNFAFPPPPPSPSPGIADVDKIPGSIRKTPDKLLRHLLKDPQQRETDKFALCYDLFTLSDCFRELDAIRPKQLIMARFRDERANDDYRFWETCYDKSRTPVDDDDDADDPPSECDVHYFRTYPLMKANVPLDPSYYRDVLNWLHRGEVDEVARLYVRLNPAAVPISEYGTLNTASAVVRCDLWRLTYRMRYGLVYGETFMFILSELYAAIRSRHSENYAFEEHIERWPETLRDPRVILNVMCCSRGRLADFMDLAGSLVKLPHEWYHVESRCPDDDDDEEGEETNFCPSKTCNVVRPFYVSRVDDYEDPIAELFANVSCKPVFASIRDDVESECREKTRLVDKWVTHVIRHREQYPKIEYIQTLRGAMELYSQLYMSIRNWPTPHLGSIVIWFHQEATELLKKISQLISLER